MAETPKKETVEVVLKNWRAEVETAQVYRDLAARESDEKRKGILLRMAEAEERHAQRWEAKLPRQWHSQAGMQDIPPRLLSRQGSRRAARGG